jgi:hypothetical protein
MPIHYTISSELNMIIYSCHGFITGAELLKTTQSSHHDQRRTHGMLSVVDLLSATIDFELQDLYQFISWKNDLKTKGFEHGNIIVLTENKGLRLTCEALNFMSVKVTLNLKPFYSLDSAIDSLGLSQSRPQIVQFWQESKSLSDGSQSISAHQNTSPAIE